MQSFGVSERWVFSASSFAIARWSVRLLLSSADASRKLAGLVWLSSLWPARRSTMCSSCSRTSRLRWWDSDTRYVHNETPAPLTAPIAAEMSSVGTATMVSARGTLNLGGEDSNRPSDRAFELSL
jgi:hypothetical protein